MFDEDDVTSRLLSNDNTTNKDADASFTHVGRSLVIRNLISFWLLGLCNNYTYVIMLSAAYDILDEDQGQSSHGSSASNSSSFLPERECNHISTGAILLANIVPSLTIKLFAPFIVSHTFPQMSIVIVAAFLNLIVVSYSVARWMTFLGVMCATISMDLGEVTLLRYSTGFDKSVVSAWSSGAGASGILGAFTYAAFTTAGLSVRKTLLIMLMVPLVMAFTFCCLLIHPVALRERPLSGNVNACEDDLMQMLTFERKMILAKRMVKYIIPLALVYFAEYFINQGLLELVCIRNTFLTHNEQYRWYQLDYHIGVFISRSSVNLVPIKRLWILPILQFANVAVFSLEAYYQFVPSVWIVFAFILFEGLVGGSSYVNTFYRISQEVPESDREFSIGVASMSDSIGIAIAGAVSIPVHNILCRSKIP